MKKIALLVLCLFVLVGVLLAEHPNQHSLEQGISIQMIPTEMGDRLPLGFAVVCSPGIPEQPAQPFHTTDEAFVYIKAHLATDTDNLNVRHHGIWIYADDQPGTKYSPAAVKQYNALLARCAKENIPVFLGQTTWREALPDIKQKP